MIPIMTFFYEIRQNILLLLQFKSILLYEKNMKTMEINKNIL